MAKNRKVLTTFFLIVCFLAGSTISAYASSNISTDSDYSSGNNTETSESINEQESTSLDSQSSDESIFEESYECNHDYANRYEDIVCTISKPGVDEMRLHFESIQLAEDDAATIGGYDKIIILDKYNNILAVYGGYYGVDSLDKWTEWFRGDTLKVGMTTDDSKTDYGFRIDKVGVRKDNTNEPPENPNKGPGTNTKEEPKPSVSLHGEKTEVASGEEILLKLSAVNTLDKPVMHVQVIIIPPSGMSVSSTEFVESGAGQYTTTYELEPGKGNNIAVKIAANQVGNFDVIGRVVYYFGNDIKNAESYTLSLPIQVKENMTSGPSTESPEKSPGFGSLTAIFGFLTFYSLKKRIQ